MTAHSHGRELRMLKNAGDEALLVTKLETVLMRLTNKEQDNAAKNMVTKVRAIPRDDLTKEKIRPIVEEVLNPLKADVDTDATSLKPSLTLEAAKSHKLNYYMNQIAEILCEFFLPKELGI